MEVKITITQLLKIPIEKIVTFPEYIEIISAGQNVGSLPYITVASLRIYDTNNQVLNKFRWEYVYSQNIDDINTLIYDLLEKSADEIQITIGIYRCLYIKDNTGNLICGISCSYRNGDWEVERT